MVVEYLLYLCTLCTSALRLALWGYIKDFRVRLACLEIPERKDYQVLCYIALQKHWDIWFSCTHSKRKSHPSSLCEVM